MHAVVNTEWAVFNGNSYWDGPFHDEHYAAGMLAKRQSENPDSAFRLVKLETLVPLQQADGCNPPECTRREGRTVCLSCNPSDRIIGISHPDPNVAIRAHNAAADVFNEEA